MIWRTDGYAEPIAPLDTRPHDAGLPGAGSRDMGRHDSGFTLLEVLVAFAIAAPALILLFNQGAFSVSAVRTSGLYQEAVSRAKSRLETLSGTVLQPGERTGDDGGGFHWSTTVVSLGSLPASNLPLHGTPPVSGPTLFDVTVEISWPGNPARHLALHTRRLGTG